MARIAGVDLPREKRVEIALTYIFGIGRPTSNRILGDTGVNPDTRVRDLSDAEVARLRQMIERSGPTPTRAPRRGRAAPSPARRK
jgi:small subunit ribosomal protein S13